MYFGRSESVKNPHYNPLDPDILLNTSLKALDNTTEKDSLKHIVQDYVKRKSINFTNVRKLKLLKKVKQLRNLSVYD